jgi:hypothetical protein
MRDDATAALIGGALLLTVAGAALERPEVRPELAGTVVILASIGVIFAIRNWLDRRGSTIVDRIRRRGF